MSKRLLLDAGSAYQSLAFAEACPALAISRRFIWTYRLRKNGNAEHLIRTLLSESVRLGA